MKLNEVMDPKQIILVCGNICSGKGHYCRANFPGFEHIQVSSIVRSLINSSERSELAKTKYLENRILEILIEQIDCYDNVIVDGIRQMGIVQGLEQHYGDQVKDIIWLDTPIETLKARFTQRSNVKDNLPFDDALQADKNLGLADVETYIRTKHKVVPY